MTYDEVRECRCGAKVACHVIWDAHDPEPTFYSKNGKGYCHCPNCGVKITDDNSKKVREESKS